MTEKSVPLIQWDANTNRKFPDMKTDGVANLLSESMLTSNVEAPLSTKLDEKAAFAFYQLLRTYSTYANRVHASWDTLTLKQKQEVCDLDLQDAKGYYGALDHLVAKGGLVLPKGYTLDIQAKASGSFGTKNPAHIELVIDLLSKTKQRRSHSVSIKLTKSKGLKDCKYVLSVKGSGLFLLQGNSDYALPSKLKADDLSDAPTELQLFVGAMKSPFMLIQSMARTAVKLRLEPKHQDDLAHIPRFLSELPNDKICVRGFTFTRYMNFHALRFKGLDTRQSFLRSLFLIYEVAKGNRRSFLNNGMKTYKGITTQTRFEDEELQRTLESEYKQLEFVTQDQDKLFRKRVKSVSDIYSIQVSKSDLKNNKTVLDHMLTSVQFTVPKTKDRARLGLASEGANFIRDNCLKVRFSIFGKMLSDYRIHSLEDLIEYLCPDHDLKTFRHSLDKLLYRVLDGYDYFYWVSMTWNSIVKFDDCKEVLTKIRAKAPKQVSRVLDLWASEEAANTPDLHSLVNLVMKIYYPKDYAKMTNDQSIDKATLQAAEKKARKLAKLVLARFGVDIKYPRAFHVMVSDAFYASTLDNLQSIQDLNSKDNKKQVNALHNQTLKILSLLGSLQSPKNWSAVALTMKPRQLNWSI